MIPLTTLIIGKRGAGKSTLALFLARDEKNLVIFDTFHEHTDGVIFNSVSDLLKHLHDSNGDNFRCIYRPLEIGDSQRFIVWYLLARRDCTLVIDEISQWCNYGYLPQYFDHLIRLGRHKNVRLICTTHRPAEVHKLIMSQSDLWISRMHESNDLKYMQRFCDANILMTVPEPVVTKKSITLSFFRPLEGKIETQTIQFAGGIGQPSIAE